MTSRRFVLFIGLLLILFYAACSSERASRSEPEETAESEMPSHLEPPVPPGARASNDEIYDVPRVTYRSNGVVEVGQLRYRSIEDFHASDSFWSEGHRCGSQYGINLSPPPIEGDQADCTFDFTSIDSSYTPDTIYQIPVVFHVIQDSNDSGHLSESRIQQQIDVLNEDFLDAGIQFILAENDPFADPTTGINHHSSDQWFLDPGPERIHPMKNALHWDPERYLNIYTNDASGVLGYATFPQEYSGQIIDGVVLLWKMVGRDLTDAGQYDQGHTATHEIGHYLGLFHSFEGGCSSPNQPYSTGDLISDTASHQHPDQTCQPRQSTCGTGSSPLHNFMNYSPDACMREFTAEQILRMRCSLLNYRPDLITFIENNEPDTPAQ